jgi:hypothetical protein
MASMDWKKVDVQNLINRKSDRITYSSNSGSSKVWENFVVVNIDGVSVHFVKCKTCNTALKWISKDGTSGLSNHTQSCKSSRTSASLKLTEMPTFCNARKTTISEGVKSDLTDAVVRMCATDIR